MTVVWANMVVFSVCSAMAVVQLAVAFHMWVNNHVGAAIVAFVVVVGLTALAVYVGQERVA